MWCNVRAVALNATLQLLVIYRFENFNHLQRLNTFQNHSTKCKCNLSIIFTISVSEIEIWKIVQIYCYIYTTSVNNKIIPKSIKSNPNKTIAFMMTLLINTSTLNWWKSQNNKKPSYCAWTLGFEPHKSSSPYLPSQKKKRI